MDLLKSVLGAVTASTSSNQAAPGGDMLKLVMSLLDPNGPMGGLPGLMQKFNQAGLGEVLQSWIGRGQNLPVSGTQLEGVLGSDWVKQLAGQLGVAPGQASGQLAQMLPGLIDQLTPDGKAPTAGLPGGADLMGLLGGLLQKR